MTQSKAHHSGLMYLGVGVGILGSSLLVDSTGAWLQGANRWIPAAALALPLALWSAWYLARLPGHGPVITTGKDDHSALWDRASTPLFLAYAGAGLGYILPMTFLPAVAADWNIKMVPSAWLLVALASLPSTWLWNHLGARIGDKPALLWNYAIQAISILALLVLEHRTGLFLCAVLMGGSFIGSVLLTQRLARTLHPHPGATLKCGPLIALYGFTQLTGPWLASWALKAEQR